MILADSSSAVVTASFAQLAHSYQASQGQKKTSSYMFPKISELATATYRTNWRIIPSIVKKTLINMIG